MEGRTGEGSLLLREGKGREWGQRGRGGEGKREGKGRREREIFAGPMSNCFWRPCYSGRFTHISGHPSAASRAQDGESSPTFYHCAMQPI